MGPNLFVIGAMKCGTTSFHEYLDHHPEISMSLVKEPDFFNKGAGFRKGWDWYISLFDPEKRIRGESSVNYSKHQRFPDVAYRIYSYKAAVKLVYLVRDPIDRLVSHIKENMSQGYFSMRNDRDINWFIQNQLNKGWVQNSLYYFQLSKYLEYFPKDQIHIVDSVHLKKDRLQVMNEVFEFLEVDTLKNDLFQYEKNQSSGKKRPSGTLQFMKQMKIDTIMPSKLKHYVLRRTALGNNLYKPLQEDRYQLDPASLSILRNLFQKDADQLRKLSGHDFTHWDV